MRNNKDAVKKEHSTPDQKQIVGLNVSLSDSFKQPLPRKMLTKKIPNDVSQKRKMVKRLKSKLKKRNHAKNSSKAARVNTDLQIVLSDKNRKRRDGSVSSSCSSSNNS